MTCSAPGLPESAASEALELLRDCLRIDTSNPPGHEKPLAELLARRFQRAGLEPELVEAAPGRTSVVVRLRGDGSARPFLLSGHLDVVPAEPSQWTHPPFAAEIHDGYVWGRGAVDMKAMVAMSAVIVETLASQGRKLKRDLIFAGVADEEAGGALGAGHLVAARPELVDAELGVTEVGGFTLPLPGRTLVPVQVAEKGVEGIVLRARGRPGHGSLPHDAQALVTLARAVERFGTPLRHRTTPHARRFLSELASAQGGAARLVLPLLMVRGLGTSLLSILPEERRRPVRAMLHDLATPTMVGGGVGPNVIPGEAWCRLDGRYLPGTTREELRALVADRAGPGVDVELHGGLGPVVMPERTPLWDAIAAVMAEEVPGCRLVPYLMPGFTDAKHYAKLGMTVYGFAPVALARDEPFASLYHAPDERISIEGFTKGLRWLSRVVEKVCT